MKKEIELNLLFDYYGELLSLKKQEYFKYYYFDNLSLTEISELMSVSRNAIHKQLKSIEEELENYDRILNLIKKDETLKEVVQTIDNPKLKKKLEELVFNY